MKYRFMHEIRIRRAQFILALGGALACISITGCLDSDRPLLSVKDPDLLPPLVTLHTLAAADTGGKAFPSRLIASQDLMAALVWAQSGDTLYQQALHANREWPMRLDIALVATPPEDALINVSGNGRGRFGMALLFLFEDLNRNGRYDAKVREAGDPPAPGDDWLWGMAGGTRVVYISDDEALAWVRMNAPRDLIFSISEPQHLQVGFNLLDAVNVRDTVFRQYKVFGPNGEGYSISDTRPDSGNYEVLSYNRKICDGFGRKEWQEEISLSVEENLNPFQHLVTVDPSLLGPR